MNPVHSNALLSALAGDDLAALGLADQVDLPLKMRLDGFDDEGRYAYFPTSGMASVVAGFNGTASIEIGIIGNEGTTSIGAVYGDDKSPFQIYVQIAGTASRYDSSRLSAAIEERPAVRHLMTRFARAFSIQVATTAMSNGRSHIDARLARWLLMASDRVGPTFEITHDFLALMLGVRRSGVTLALQILEGQGLIRSKRGQVSILQRIGLVETCQGAYGFSEQEYKRLLSNETVDGALKPDSEFVR